MGDNATADQASTARASAAASREPNPESITSALLRERSRRTTVTKVLDRLIETGGQFAEKRQDGSGWSASVPAAQPRETPTR